jgi:hypothetical protein
MADFTYANLNDDGECDHHQPLNGFCSQCRRVDSKKLECGWGPEMLPKKRELIQEAKEGGDQ